MVASNIVVRGDTRARYHAKQGKQPMTAIRPEKIESTDEDTDLAAASEVEAGIRDFVRNDIAYLRRPVSLTNPEPSAARFHCATLSAIMRVDFIAA